MVGVLPHIAKEHVTVNTHGESTELLEERSASDQGLHVDIECIEIDAQTYNLETSCKNPDK